MSYAHALYDIYDANGDHHLGMQDLDALYSKMDTDGNTIECLCKHKANNIFTIAMLRLRNHISGDGTVSKTDFYTFWNQVGGYYIIQIQKFKLF